MPIAPPPTSPDITDPSTFAPRAQAHVLWQSNDLYPALADASLVLNLSTTSTSTTTNTIGTGAKTFIVDTGKGYSATQTIAIYGEDPSNIMFGTVTSYNTLTGELIVNIDSFSGSGTYSSWAIVYSAAADANNIDYVQAGAGAVTRTVQGKLRENVSVKDFGAIGDGVANDYDEFVLAVAASSNKKLIVPAGTYLLPFSATTGLSILTNCTIEGDGAGVSIVEFRPDSATFRNLIGLAANNVTFKNITIRVVAQSTQELAFFNISANNLTFENCDFDGAMTNSGATLSHTAHCFSFASTGTQADINVKDCAIHGFSFGVLKTNTATSIQQRLTFNNCDLYSNYNEDLSFNSPLGAMQDVIVSSCRFYSGAGSSASLSQLHCSFASINRFIVDGCTFAGEVGDAIHIEENCFGGIVDGNSIRVDGNGILVTDNNIGGSSLMPQAISITNNTVIKSGTPLEANKYGIQLVFDGTAEVPAKNTIISNNVVLYFERAYSIGATIDDACEVSRNIADNCTFGFWCSGAFKLSSNTSRVCTTGIYANLGGVLADHHTFIDCGTNADAVSQPMTLIDCIFQFPEFDVGASSTTYKNLTALGANDRAHGFFNALVNPTGAANVAINRDEVTWDGTTFTKTNKIRYEPGAVDIDSVRNASILALSIFAATAQTNLTVQVKFEGCIIVAV